MDKSRCCGTGTKSLNDAAAYEVVRLQKTANVCPMCEDYAKRQETKSIAVMCCEGACLRGEVARQAANILCHTLAPDKTVRICLGGAFTKDTGQRNLVKNAEKVIAVEGCYINCASRMMQGVIGGLNPEVIVADRLYEFDRNIFGIDEMTAEEIADHGRTVARKIFETL